MIFLAQFLLHPFQTITEMSQWNIRGWTWVARLVSAGATTAMIVPSCASLGHDGIGGVVSVFVLLVTGLWAIQFLFAVSVDFLAQVTGLPAKTMVLFQWISVIGLFNLLGLPISFLGMVSPPLLVISTIFGIGMWLLMVALHVWVIKTTYDVSVGQGVALWVGPIAIVVVGSIGIAALSMVVVGMNGLL